MSTTTTPSKLGITPGEAILGDEQDAGAEVELANGNRILFDRDDPMTGKRVNTRDEMLANVHLVIDAHNTANACGMLPSEILAELTKLRAERDEALKSLRTAREALSFAMEEGVYVRESLKVVNEVLAKHSKVTG